MTLSEFLTERQVTNVWFVSHGHPTGCELIHNADATDPEDYCDLTDPFTLSFIADLDVLHELEGEAENGRWEWNCEGELTDENQNTIQRLVFYAE